MCRVNLRPSNTIDAHDDDDFKIDGILAQERIPLLPYPFDACAGRLEYSVGIGLQKIV